MKFYTSIPGLLAAVLAAVIGWLGYTGQLKMTYAASGVTTLLLGSGLYFILVVWEIDTVSDKLDTSSKSSLSGSPGIDEVWSDLQDWMEKDPRDNELKWRAGNTYIRAVMADSMDGESFIFMSIITPDQNDEQLHTVVETRTGAIVNHSPTEFKDERYQPFKRVPFVRRLLDEPFTGEDAHSQLQNQALGMLSGGYGHIPVGNGFQVGNSGGLTQIDSGEVEEVATEDEQ